MELEQGNYSGDLVDNVAHGQGQMVYRDNDPMNREVYTGQWVEGRQTGEGEMRFRSGDTYCGLFKVKIYQSHGSS